MSRGSVENVTFYLNHTWETVLKFKGDTRYHNTKLLSINERESLKLLEGTVNDGQACDTTSANNGSKRTSYLLVNR